MRTLLLLIDLQRAFCDENGSTGLQGRDVTPLAAAAQECQRLAVIAHAHDVPVAWTRMMLRPDYSDGGTLLAMRPNLARIGALRAGTPDVDLSGLVTPGESDLIIDKPRYSSVYATSLEAHLRAMRIDRVVVGGVTTSMCVETTVRDLSQRDYEVIVAQEACADFDDSRHQASLEAMAFGFAPIARKDEAAAALFQDSWRQN
ncbi:cysteine hydrolase family protein [Microvirga antarctica]|uniref:cysteine hydrolase family protein n=1 Tax=Microvirga antarctica TaxID=2819233 RepID=UPI001B31246B|nr:isochorismatase family cysteine hydrolase [Microvirga antarctica]